MHEKGAGKGIIDIGLITSCDIASTIPAHSPITLKAGIMEDTKFKTKFYAILNRTTRDSEDACKTTFETDAQQLDQVISIPTQTRLIVTIEEE